MHATGTRRNHRRLVCPLHTREHMHPVTLRLLALHTLLRCRSICRAACLERTCPKHHPNRCYLHGCVVLPCMLTFYPVHHMRSKWMRKHGDDSLWLTWTHK